MSRRATVQQATLEALRELLGDEVPQLRRAGEPPCKGCRADTGWECDKAPSARVVAGCKHEHVSERLFCRWHLDDIRAGDMLCGECHEAGCPCRLVVARTEAL